MTILNKKLILALLASTLSTAVFASQPAPAGEFSSSTSDSGMQREVTHVLHEEDFRTATSQETALATINARMEALEALIKISYKSHDDANGMTVDAISGLGQLIAGVRDNMATAASLASVRDTMATTALLTQWKAELEEKQTVITRQQVQLAALEVRLTELRETIEERDRQIEERDTKIAELEARLNARANRQ
jgi:chromosome segregation ATPase